MESMICKQGKEVWEGAICRERKGSAEEDVQRR
jgi:hypothetical protein